MENKISVVINTYNASRHLREVLDSVREFDEIVICDMESTDDTLHIAEEYGCKIVTFEKKNHSICEVARDFAIHSASYKWVFVVDADEIVPSQLREYLYSKITDSKFDSALAVGRKNPFMGKYISNSPDYQLRFFQQAKAHWPAVIHARPVIEGEIRDIPAKDGLMLIHLDDAPIAKIIAKHNTYTDYEVPRRIGRRFSISSMLCRPVIFFFKSYIMGGAFLHGKRGVINAYMKAIYQMMLISKVVEKQLENENNQTMRD